MWSKLLQIIQNKTVVGAKGHITVEKIINHVSKWLLGYESLLYVQM